MPLAQDLMHPSLAEEKRKHKKKRLVQSPNSFFMDVKCPGCYRITTIFSHAQAVIVCGGCSFILSQPKGGEVLSVSRLFLQKEANLSEHGQHRAVDWHQHGP